MPTPMPRARQLVLAVGVLCALLVAVAAPAAADPIGNPSPGLFGPAIGGSGYFAPAEQVLSIEIQDYGEVFGLGGAEFGFFFQGADVSNAANRTVIFETTDQDPDPGGLGSIGQFALVDFTLGHVVDIDADGGPDPILQNTFTPSSNDIGFYLDLSPALANYYGVDILYTDPLLNAGSVDHVSTFPSLTSSTDFLFAFGAVDPASGLWAPVGFQVALNLNAVPEPATGLLVFLGGAAVFGGARRRRRRQAD